MVNVVSLWRQLSRDVPGSRLTLKLVGRFLPVVLIPAAALYLFSYWALDRGVESWFNVEVETALDDSIALGRHALNAQMRRHREEIEPLLEQLDDVPDDMAGFALSSLLEQSNADEIVLLAANGRILSAAGADLDLSLIHI